MKCWDSEGALEAQVVARRVDAREVALAHGGHARLQLGDDGAAQHRQPVTRPATHTAAHTATHHAHSAPPARTHTHTGTRT